MKKAKCQQHFHCCIVCILDRYAFWFSFQKDIVTILISTVVRGAAVIRGEAVIIGRRLFQCGYPEVPRLFEGGTYLRLGTYQSKYGKYSDYQQRHSTNLVKTNCFIKCATKLSCTFCCNFCCTFQCPICCIKSWYILLKFLLYFSMKFCLKVQYRVLYIKIHRFYVK